MSEIRIAPSILSADFGRLADEVRAIERGGADWVHVDVMDGHFVPNLTLGPPVIAAVRAATALPLDVHLMTTNADRYVADYAAAGADVLTVHAEACTHLHRTVQRIHGLGKRAGVALNPATPIDALRYVLDDIDLVLVMTVNPGFGGQQLIAQVVDKIRAVRAVAEARGLALDVEVDGGVKVDNVDLVAAAGANVIVSGSGVFAGGDVAEAIDALRAAATRAAVTA